MYQNRFVYKKRPGISILLNISLFIYALLLPISTGLSGVIGNISLSNYFASGIIIFGILNCLQRDKLTIPKYAVPTILYGLYSAISFAWVPEYKLNWYVGTNLVNVLMIIVLCACRYDVKLETLKKWIGASQIIVFIAVLANLNSIYKYRLNIVVFSTIGINDFACGLCLLIALWMGVTTLDKKRWRGISCFMIALDLAIIFLAGSRGALIMFFAMVMIWVVFGDYSKKTKVYTGIFIVIAFVFFSTKFINYLPNTIRSRMSFEAVQQTHGSGRYNVWRLAWRTFQNANPIRKLFGFGFNSFTEVVKYGDYGGVHDLMAHNVVLQTMIEGGLVGLSLLLFMIYSQIKMAWKRNDTFMKTAVVGLFIAAMSIDMQVTRVWGFILAMNIVQNRNKPIEDLQSSNMK